MLQNEGCKMKRRLQKKIKDLRKDFSQIETSTILVISDIGKDKKKI